MNKAYRLIWSRVKEAWVVVAEKVKGKGGPMPVTVSLLAALALAAGNASALPTGPQVVSGTVGIATSGTTMNITNSPSAIINWQGFSIAANEATRFIQQSAASSVLNRVIGGNSSQIYGMLQSNGRVFLINQNGILFGPNAKIDVNGLVASTLNITNQDFLAGRMKFTADPLAGKLENQGTITTPNGGSVYLIAPDVQNSGVITAPNGSIMLAAGKDVLLVDSDTPEIAVVVSAPENQALNLGALTADAGRIGLYGGLVRQKGIVSASSAVAEGGKIFLRATNKVELGQGSVTSADGTKGGTVIAMTSENGRISGELTAQGSIITARGDGSTGSGGFVETSAAKVDLNGISVNSGNGTWLIDPLEFIVAATGGDRTGAQIASDLAANNMVYTSETGAGGDTGNIWINDTITWNNGNSLTFTAKNDLFVNSPITNSGAGSINLYAGWDGQSPATAPVLQSCVGCSAYLYANISTLGELTVNAGTATSITSTLTSGQAMSLGGTVNLNGGTLAGAGALTTSGSVTISGNTTLNGKTWNNDGSVDVTGVDGQLALANGAVVNNNATFTLSGSNASPLAYGGGSASVFNNYSELIKQTDNGTQTIGINGAFNNIGYVLVNNGILNLATSGTHTGLFQAEPTTGASLVFSGGSHVLNGAYFGGGAIHLNGATLDVAATTGIDYGTFSMESGTLTGSGDFVLRRDAFLSGGTLSGTGTLRTDYNAFIDGTIILNGKLWENTQGLFIQGGGSIVFSDGAEFTNTGTFIVESSSTNANPLYNNGGTNLFSNAGIFNKNSTNTQTINISGTFNHSTGGTLTVDAGTLNLVDNGNHNGSFVINDGAALNFNAGIHTLHTDTNFTTKIGAIAPGQVQLSGATLSVDAPAGLIIASGGPTFNMSSGILTGSGALTLNNTFNITGNATLNGSGIVTTSGTTTINNNVTGTIYLDLDGKTWDNLGTLTIGGDDYLRFVSGTSTLTNKSGGTLNLSSSHATPINFGLGTATLTNEGTLNQTETGTHTINNYVTFNNSGTASVSAGTLQIGGSGSDSGSYVIASGSTVNLTGGTRTLSKTFTTSGTGTLQLSGATVNYNDTSAALALSSTNPLLLSGGTLGGSGALSISGLFDITGNATLSGTGILTTSGTTTISGSPWLTTKSWLNSGTIDIRSAGSLVLTNGAAFTNELDGIFALSGTNSTPVSSGGGQNYFNNFGQLFKEFTASQSLNFGGSVVNTGTISVNAGTLTMPFADGSNEGTLAIASGAVLSTNGSSLNNGSTAYLTGSGTLDLGSGTLTNSGIIKPGGYGTVGTLSITGNLVLGSSGMLEIDATGKESGMYDVLAVSGTTAMGGALQATITGFTPVNGDYLPFLTSGGTASGTFTTVTALTGFNAGYNLATGEAARLIYALSGENVFTNASGGLAWETPGNWSFNAIPTATDTALISIGTEGASTIVTHGVGNDTIAGLTINNYNILLVTGGSLTVTGETSLSGELHVSGAGAATLQGYTTGSGLLGISNGTLTLNGPVNVGYFAQSGGTLNGIGSLSFFNGLTKTGGVFEPTFTSLDVNQANGNLISYGGPIGANGPVNLSAMGGNLQVEGLTANGPINLQAPGAALILSGPVTQTGTTATQLYVSGNAVSIQAATISSPNAALDMVVGTAGGPVRLLNSTVDTNNGNLTITGVGNEVSGTGVGLTNTLITSGTGDVSIEGTGKTTAETGSFAGVVLNRSSIETDSGTVTITGFGGQGTDGHNHGVLVSGVFDSEKGTYSSSSISTVGGNISITGYGGSGHTTNYSNGVAVNAGSSVQSPGAVTIIGYGSPMEGTSIGVALGGNEEAYYGALVSGSQVLIDGSGLSADASVPALWLGEQARVESPNGLVSLKTTGADSTIFSIGQRPSALINATMLDVYGSGTVTLTGQNTVAQLSAHTGGDFFFTTSGNLDIGANAMFSGVWSDSGLVGLTVNNGRLQVSQRSIGAWSGITLTADQGILLADSSVAILSGGTGSVTLTGGGNSTGLITSRSGIEAYNSSISGQGPVSLTGIGATATDSNNLGIVLAGTSVYGAASVTLNGTGGGIANSTVGTQNAGVMLTGTAQKDVETSTYYHTYTTINGPAITVAGRGGTGSGNNPGIVLDGRFYEGPNNPHVVDEYAGAALFGYNMVGNSTVSLTGTGGGFTGTYVTPADYTSPDVALLYGAGVNAFGGPVGSSGTVLLSSGVGSAAPFAVLQDLVPEGSTRLPSIVQTNHLTIDANGSVLLPSVNTVEGQLAATVANGNLLLNAPLFGTGGITTVTSIAVPNGSVELNAYNLAVNGPINTGPAGLTLGAAADLTLASNLTLGRVDSPMTLTAGGAILAKGAGDGSDYSTWTKLVGTTLTATAGNGITLGPWNDVATVSFANTGGDIKYGSKRSDGFTVNAATTSGKIELEEFDGTLTVAGPVDTGSGGSIFLGADSGRLAINGAVSGTDVELYAMGIGASTIGTAGSLTAGGNLGVTLAGGFTADGPVKVTGSTTLSGFGSDLLFASDQNGFGGTVTVMNGKNVLVSNSGHLAIGGTVNGNLSIAADGVTFDSRALDGVYGTVGVTTVGGNLGVISTGAVDQLSPLLAIGSSSFSAGSADITLNNATNDFGGPVKVGSAQHVMLHDSNALTINGTMSGNLAITSGGTITQNDPLKVTGTSGLDAAGNDILLNNAANVFGNAVIVASGKNVTLAGSTDLTMYGNMLSGVLNAAAGNNLQIEHGGSLQLGSAQGTDINVLVMPDEGGKGHLTLTGQLNAPTGIVRLAVDNGAILDATTIGPAITAGSLGARAANGIGTAAAPLKTQVSTLNLANYGSSGDIVVANSGELTVGDALLGSGFGIVNSAPSGTVALNNAGSIHLPGTLVPPDATISYSDGIHADGAITVNAAGATADITAGGDSLAADSGSGSVTLTAGRDILLGDTNGYGDIFTDDGTGSISLIAGRDIAITNYSWLNSASGAIDLQAGRNLTVSDISEIVSFEGGAVTLKTTDGTVNLNLTTAVPPSDGMEVPTTETTTGRIETSGSLTITTGKGLNPAEVTMTGGLLNAGSLTVQSAAGISLAGGSLQVSGNSSFTASSTNAVNLGNVANDFGGWVSVSGSDFVILRDAFDLQLGQISSATAAGTVDITAPTIIAGTGSSVSAGSIRLAGSTIELNGGSIGSQTATRSIELRTDLITGSATSLITDQGVVANEISIAPLTAGQSIGVAGGSGDLHLEAALFNQLRTPTLVIGSYTGTSGGTVVAAGLMPSGAVTVGNLNWADGQRLGLLSDSGVSSVSGTTLAMQDANGTLGVLSGGEVNLASAVRNLAVQSPAAVNISNSGSLNIVTVTAGSDTARTINGISGSSVQLTTVGSGADLVLQAPLNVGSSGTVNLAVAGAVTDPSAARIIGNSLSISAETGIGSSIAPITTQVALLQKLYTATGDIYVDNYGAVRTGDLPGMVKAPSGSVGLRAHSPLTIGSGGVDAGGNILLAALGTGATSTTDILTLDGLVSAGGNLELAAGNAIVETVTASAGGTITRKADQNNPLPPPPPPPPKPEEQIVKEVQKEVQQVVQSSEVTTSATIDTAPTGLVKIVETDEQEQGTSSGDGSKQSQEDEDQKKKGKDGQEKQQSGGDKKDEKPKKNYCN